MLREAFPHGRSHLGGFRPRLERSQSRVGGRILAVPSFRHAGIDVNATYNTFGGAGIDATTAPAIGIAGTDITAGSFLGGAGFDVIDSAGAGG